MLANAKQFFDVLRQRMNELILASLISERLTAMEGGDESQQPPEITLENGSRLDLALNAQIVYFRRNFDSFAIDLPYVPGHQHLYDLIEQQFKSFKCESNTEKGGQKVKSNCFSSTKFQQ